MQYLLTFLEGVISFLSPCMLPLLPVYVSYFAGSAGVRSKVLPRAGGFVLGFTVVFTALGLFAGTLGGFLARYQTVVNVVCGLLVILLGLSYLELIRIPFFKGMQAGREIGSVFSAVVFGMIYSVSLTPCVGAFLGSALMQAASSGGAGTGALLLLTYSLGLGVPFVISAVLLDRLQSAFLWIKRHYKTVNLICGLFLILIGVLMALGLMNAVMAVFS